MKEYIEILTEPMIVKAIKWDSNWTTINQLAEHLNCEVNKEEPWKTRFEKKIGNQTISLKSNNLRFYIMIKNNSGFSRQVMPGDYLVFFNSGVSSFSEEEFKKRWSPRTTVTQIIKGEETYNSDRAGINMKLSNVIKESNSVDKMIEDYLDQIEREGQAKLDAVSIVKASRKYGSLAINKECLYKNKFWENKKSYRLVQGELEELGYKMIESGNLISLRVIEDEQ